MILWKVNMCTLLGHSKQELDRLRLACSKTFWRFFMKWLLLLMVSSFNCEIWGKFCSLSRGFVKKNLLALKAYKQFYKRFSNFLKITILRKTWKWKVFAMLWVWFIVPFFMIVDIWWSKISVSNIFFTPQFSKMRLYQVWQTTVQWHSDQNAVVCFK